MSPGVACCGSPIDRRMGGSAGGPMPARSARSFLIPTSDRGRRLTASSVSPGRLARARRVETRHGDQNLPPGRRPPFAETANARGAAFDFRPVSRDVPAVRHVPQCRACHGRPSRTNREILRRARCTRSCAITSRCSARMRRVCATEKVCLGSSRRSFAPSCVAAGWPAGSRGSAARRAAWIGWWRSRVRGAGPVRVAAAAG